MCSPKVVELPLMSSRKIAIYNVTALALVKAKCTIKYSSEDGTQLLVSNM